MTEPNAKLLADPEVPTVTLDGKAWPIPKLAMVQLKVLLPLLSKYWEAGKAVASVGTAEGVDAMGTIVFTALLRGHDGENGRPGPITRAEFDEMAIDSKALFLAVRVVAEQTGGYTQAKPGAAGPLVPPDSQGSDPAKAADSQTGTP